MVSLKSDELLDVGAQGALAREIAAAKNLSHQDAEPNLDLVEPRCVFGCEVKAVKANAMLRVAQECFSGCLGGEHASDFPLTPRSILRPQALATRRTTDSERWMFEIVANDVPLRGGSPRC